jgi:hypothetical protein
VAEFLQNSLNDGSDHQRSSNFFALLWSWFFCSLYILSGLRPLPPAGSSSFGLSQKKGSKEKLKSRVLPPRIRETGFTEPLRGFSTRWADENYNFDVIRNS